MFLSWTTILSKRLAHTLQAMEKWCLGELESSLKRKP